MSSDDIIVVVVGIIDVGVDADDDDVMVCVDVAAPFEDVCVFIKVVIVAAGYVGVLLW